MTRGEGLDEALFRGETINTPSMLCVEDYLDALRWAQSLGGLDTLRARADANLAVVAAWEKGSSWAAFLARDPATRSNTSVCLEIVDPAVKALSPDARAAFVGSVAARLEDEGVAFDVAGHRDAPPNLRIWCGATVEASDVEALLPWLDWAFAEAVAALPRRS
jgi:phosphoserine aminotransferase